MAITKLKNAVRPLVRRTRGAVSEAIWDYLMKPAPGRSGRTPYGAAELKLLRIVLRSQNLCSVDGQQVRAFERAFAAAHDVPYAVASTSGTAAIHTALGALDLEPGAEVITAPITDLGTIIPIIQQNAIPVFADVDASYNMDPADVARKVTPRTKAIIAVHLFGNPCDLTKLQAIADAHGLALIEDCSQAHFAEYRGRLVGTIGDLGCFSFQQSKLMTTGDGGMTITRNREYAERMKLFIDKGWARKGFGPRAYLFHAPNYRMSELVGAVGTVQLGKLRDVVSRRRELAALLSERLAGIEGIAPVPVTAEAVSSYWVYPATVAGGGAALLAEQLRAHKVWAMGGYIGKPIYLCSESLVSKKTFGTSQWPFTIHEPEVTYEYRPGLCPTAEAGLDRLLTLPLDESWTRERVIRTSEVLARCLDRRHPSTARRSSAGIEPTTAATAPAPVAPATLGAPVVASVGRRVRVAIIGCGQMGRWHLEAYQRNPAVEVVAFADSSREAAERFAALAGGRAYGSHRELLGAEQVDGVSVCVVPAAHREVVTDAVAAGAHVLCEKPLATSLADARAMVAAARSKGRHLVTGFKFRFFDEVREAKTLIDSGSLGRVVSARLMFAADLDMTGKWFADPRLAGGGIVMDNAPHAFDLVELLLGPISAVAATARNARRLPVEDSASINCQLRSGAAVSIDLSWAIATPPTAYLEIYADQGTAALDYGGMNYRLATWSEWKRSSNTNDGKKAFARQIDHFSDVLRGAEPSVVPATAGVRAQQLIEVAYASINSRGRAINVEEAEDLVLVGGVAMAADGS
ncbi:MAG: DegT/DnrJ/EryC1/StrS family aminotransferase [Acidobacteriota bacterium]|nr:DegT/DnrJ/EryC1/StrS family aminotransferase [Acidobacteriota bacterium]